MLASLHPLLHGDAGLWDEVLCLIPSLVLLVLMGYFYVRERQKTRASAPTNPPDPEKNETSRTED
jgi:hypothetical protein